MNPEAVFRKIAIAILMGVAGSRLHAEQPGYPLKPGQTWIDSVLKVEFQYCPPGSFLMGTNSDYIYHMDDQIPQHTVRISRGFWLSRDMITQGTWKRIMGDVPSRTGDEDVPVVMVSWYDCQAFVDRLNKKAGYAAYRLPTEAEWEYACLSGRTHPVDGTQPNSWGLVGMLGGLRQWCSDWMGPYAGHAQTDPQGPAQGKYRINRGKFGTMRGEEFRRSECRWYYTPDFKDEDLGFRLVRVVD